MTEKYKDMLERIVELIKEDKELHDSVVRLIDATSEFKRSQTEWVKSKAERTRPKKREKI